MIGATAGSDTAPRIVIATAVGQWHDMGALTVALTAAEFGWHPLYYGPNLPVEEIAAAVKQSSARAVAISITHLLEHHPLVNELRKLRRYIGSDLIIYVGGQAVSGHPQIIEEINAKHIPTIEQLSEEFDSALDENVD
jgi:MerR family transcriptional regulator, light-induced transcriptional regulator